MQLDFVAGCKNIRQKMLCANRNIFSPALCIGDCTSATRWSGTLLKMVKILPVESLTLEPISDKSHPINRRPFWRGSLVSYKIELILLRKTGRDIRYLCGYKVFTVSHSAVVYFRIWIPLNLQLRDILV